jgi:hypothetical protein
MSFYWIKTHLLIKKLFSRYIWDFPIPKKKCTSHSMTDLLQKLQNGFGKTRSAQPLFFFALEKISKHTHLF